MNEPIAVSELKQIVAETVAEALKAAGFARPPAIGHSLQGAADAASLSRRNLFQAVRAGELPARKRGAKTVILDCDLRRWLESLPPARYEPVP